jgi:hypothetical protein
MPLPRWLGTLLAPAEDPRRGAVSPASTPQTEELLAELRRSRTELSQLRSQIEARDEGSPVAEELAEQEQELLAAEQSLLLLVDERRAHEALLKARHQAAEAQLQAGA